MLQVWSADRIDVLARGLADVLSSPMPDPFTPECLVVASAGTERWLQLQLAQQLGTSGPARADGVAANLELLFPGRFIARALHDEHTDDDPWQLDHLVWTVLEVLRGGDEGLGSLTELPEGATWWGRARRLADLYDRYLLHRPDMLRAWAASDDVDAAGHPLSATTRWQPHLFRLVRARIGRPSPAEARPERLAAISDGSRPCDLPERVSLFGLTTLPGGPAFLELLDAVAAGREVHLFLLQPSAGLAEQVQRALATTPLDSLARQADRTLDLVAHPLLRSWARPHREALVLLARAGHTARALEGSAPEPAGKPTRRAAAGPRPASPNLLQRLQSDLRAGVAPTGDLVPPPGDDSIRIHSCHGPTRQVEVLRDQVLHLLADDTTLAEDDIVVLCPALEQFAPLVESVFGPSAPAGTDRWPDQAPHAHTSGPPALAYRIADRSLRHTVPLLAALSTLLELLGSRFSDAAVLEFVNLAPVRRRFDLDDQAVDAIARWVETADTRWGLDGEHRAAWGIPADYEVGSWRAALDRLLLGVAASDDDDALVAGRVAPLGVEGGDVAVAGRLADLLARLDRLACAAGASRPLHAWCRLLREAAAELFDSAPPDRWQQNRLANVLSSLETAAELDGAPCTVELELADVRRLLGQHLRGTGGRPDFFRGGITVSSLTPLRNVRFRVVCLLGMDEGAFGSGGVDGDDLVAQLPRLGDRDPRAETRQALLEAVLAAGDHLVLTRTGHSVVTNQPVPASVPVAELRDVVAATLHADVREQVLEDLERVHPRQRFDERNFEPASPWSFDPVARDGAVARTRPRGERPPFLPRPLEAADPDVIDLADLREFLDHPVKHFLRRVLRVQVPERPERSGGRPVQPVPGASGAPRAPEGRDLVVELDALQTWKLADRLLAHRLDGGAFDRFARRELAVGTLPPGRRAQAELDDADARTAPLLAALAELGFLGAPATPRLIDLTLPDGTRLVGATNDARGRHPGPVAVRPGEIGPQHHLAAWLELMLLVAADPRTPWWSVSVGYDARKKIAVVDALAVATTDPQERRRGAEAALAVAVDCFRRGRREPAPLFRKLSHALTHDGHPARAWDPGQRHGGDRLDVWNRMAFDNATLEHLLAVPARPDDPPGRAEGRVLRWAQHLWTAVDGSTVDPLGDAHDRGDEQDAP